MLTETNIHDAFSAHRSEIEDLAVLIVRRAFKSLMLDGVVTSRRIRNAYNSRSTHGAAKLAMSLTRSTRDQDAPVQLDEERVAKHAAKHADSVVEAMVQKVLAKVGDMHDAELVDVRGSSFTLKGKLGDHTVQIDQITIINISKLGKLFNQWPATIKIDGKRISAKGYGELVAAAA